MSSFTTATSIGTAPGSPKSPSAEGAQGSWLPLMEYAMKKGVSLSTLRRYIKADKITYRVEGGRYLLLDSDGASSGATVAGPIRNAVAATAAPAVAAFEARAAGFAEAAVAPASVSELRSDAASPVSELRSDAASKETSLLYFTVNQLQTELKRAQEEIAELKMLVAIYEERIPHSRSDV